MLETSVKTGSLPATPRHRCKQRRPYRWLTRPQYPRTGCGHTDRADDRQRWPKTLQSPPQDGSPAHDRQRTPELDPIGFRLALPQGVLGGHRLVFTKEGNDVK